MDGRQIEEQLREVERWMRESSIELDDALTAASIDPEDFRHLASEPPAFTAEQLRLYQELTEGKEDPHPVEDVRAAMGIRI